MKKYLYLLLVLITLANVSCESRSAKLKKAREAESVDIFIYNDVYYVKSMRGYKDDIYYRLYYLGKYTGQNISHSGFMQRVKENGFNDVEPVVLNRYLSEVLIAMYRQKKPEAFNFKQ